MAKSFGFTQIIMQEYVHKIARPVVLSDTFFYINACSQMVWYKPFEIFKILNIYSFLGIQIVYPS